MRIKIEDIIQALTKLQSQEDDFVVSIEVEPIIEEIHGWGKPYKRYIKYQRTITITDKNPIEEEVE